MSDAVENEIDLASRVEQLRSAYCLRDIDAMVACFSDDAELVAAPGVFRGKDEIRGFLQWDATLSPSVTIDDAGLGVRVFGSSAVWERVIHLTYEGVPYHEDVVTILEFGASGRIRRYRSYYDKLAVLQQVAAGLPGAGGWIAKQVIDVFVAAGSAGLEEQVRRTTP